MFGKQSLKIGLRYFLSTVASVGSCFLLASFLPTLFRGYLSDIFIEWIIFLFMLTGFSINLYISIFKLKKKFPVSNGVFGYYIFVQILFCFIVFFSVLSDTLTT